MATQVTKVKRVAVARGKPAAPEAAPKTSRSKRATTSETAADRKRGASGDAARTRSATAAKKVARSKVAGTKTSARAAGKRGGASVTTRKPKQASAPAAKSARSARKQGRKAGGRTKVKTTRQTKRTSSAKAKTRGKAAIVAVPRTVRIRALDPQVRCGPGTSVQHLFRVDEQGNGKGVTTHLVFFDRHGWYCEHGRTCPAVEDVRKSQGQLVRINQVG